MPASAHRQNDLIDTLQVVELAEGVEVHLPVAGAAARGQAFLIDVLIRFLLISIVGLLLALLAGMMFGWDVGGGVYIICAFLIDWFYFIFFEYFRGGMTPGKKSVGLRVVQESGQAITMGQAVLRNFLRYVDTFPGVLSPIGLTSMVLSKRSQRLGDLAAGTLVIYTDEPKLYPPMLRDITPPLDVPPEVPPAMLTRSEQRAVTSFVERAAIWSDERREELANLLHRLTGRTGVDGVRKLVAFSAWINRS